MRISEAWTAGQTKYFSIPGNFFYLHGASSLVSGSVSVNFWKSGARLDIDLVSADPGDWARVFPSGFDQIEILSTLAQTITFKIARGDVGTNAPPPGVVSVLGTVSISGVVSTVEGSRARTLLGSSFFGSIGAGGSPANYTHVELWNPVGSGVRAVVSQFMLSSQSGTGASLKGHTGTALANLNGSAPNKLLGAARSLSELRYEANASALGITYPYLAYQAIAPTSTGPSIVLQEPIIVNPGNGLLAGTDNVNQDLSASFEFFEEAYP